jgi:hypothetical protein
MRSGTLNSRMSTSHCEISARPATPLQGGPLDGIQQGERPASALAEGLPDRLRHAAVMTNGDSARVRGDGVATGIRVMGKIDVLFIK